MRNEKMGAKKKNQVGKKSIRSMCAHVSGCVYTQVGACLYESMHMRVYVCAQTAFVCMQVCALIDVCVSVLCVYTRVCTCNICAHMCVCLGKDIYM